MVRISEVKHSENVSNLLEFKSRLNEMEGYLFIWLANFQSIKLSSAPESVKNSISTGVQSSSRFIEALVASCPGVDWTNNLDSADVERSTEW